MIAGKFSRVALETLESRLVPTSFRMNQSMLIVDATQDKDFLTYKAANIKLTNDRVVNYSTGESFVLPKTVSIVRITGSQTGDVIDASEFTRRFQPSYGPAVDVYIELNGGYGDDKIIGSPQRDIINGGTGNDEIWGMDGNDTVYGGTGNDFIDGGYGYDVLLGEAGNDIVRAGEINQKDYFFGSNHVQLYGSTSRNAVTMWGSMYLNFTLTNFSGDVLLGGDGDDVLVGKVDPSLNQKHSILMQGGTGKDFFDGETKPEDMSQNTCVSVAVDREMFYTSRNFVNGKYVYTGVTYEQLAPRTRFVNSYTTQPLVWNYGWSA